MTENSRKISANDEAQNAIKPKIEMSAGTHDVSVARRSLSLYLTAVFFSFFISYPVSFFIHCGPSILLRDWLSTRALRQSKLTDFS